MSTHNSVVYSEWERFSDVETSWSMVEDSRKQKFLLVFGVKDSTSRIANGNFICNVTSCFRHNGRECGEDEVERRIGAQATFSRRRQVVNGSCEVPVLRCVE